MNPQRLLSTVLLLILCLILPVYAHVPVTADGNTDITHALSIEKPTRSYVIYGDLPEAGDVAYYQIYLNPGERLSLSLMTTGFTAPVPDMIVMSPGSAPSSEEMPSRVIVPQGYGAEIIRGEPPHRAEYEPFGPGAVYEVASYQGRLLHRDAITLQL